MEKKQSHTQPIGWLAFENEDPPLPPMDDEAREEMHAIERRREQERQHSAGQGEREAVREWLGGLPHASQEVVEDITLVARVILAAERSLAVEQRREGGKEWKRRDS